MATILAHITVKDGYQSEFEQLARTLFRDSHSSEAGLLRYEYWRGQSPRSYYTLLSFRTYEDFIVHQVSPHHEQATSRLGEVIAELRLEWLDPLEGASDLPPAQPEILTNPADPVLVKAARVFPSEFSAWWGPAGES